MSYDHGPLIFLKAQGASPDHDVYEVQLHGSSCGGAAGGNEHPPEACTEVFTSTGTIWVCRACESVWLTPRRRPPPRVGPRDDAEDAARYRYLRDNPHFAPDFGRLEWYLPALRSGDKTREERLDASIDQAIKEKSR